MYDIVSIGNATQDVFVRIHPKGPIHADKLSIKRGSKIEVLSLERRTGGGATNTAVAFARLGLRTGISAVLGKDEAAAAVMKELKEEKVNTKMVSYLKDVGTAYSVILTGFGDRIVLHYCGATCEVDYKGDLKWNELKKAKRFYVSSLHATPDNLKRIVDFARNNKIWVALNPGGVELGYGLKRLEGVLKQVDLLFLNEEEAQLLTGRGNYKRAFKELSKYVPLVVITRGQKGAAACDGKKIYKIGTIKVRKLDTTGAGDAFNSAFTAAIAQGLGIEEALRWGVANSHSVLGHIGTKNILLTRAGIKKFWDNASKKDAEVKVGNC